MDSAASKMAVDRDSGNVIEIIGGDGANSWDDRLVLKNRHESVDAISDLIYDGQPSKKLGSEPPNKEGKNAMEMNQSMEIKTTFFKTPRCVTDYASSIKESQHDLQNWNAIGAAYVETREEFPIPSLNSLVGTQRSSRGRHCHMFHTDSGCPEGEKCLYLHDHEAKGRERNAITLANGPRDGNADGRATANGGGPPLAPAATPPLAPKSTLKPANWRTKICNKWQQTGFCSFGSRCTFAHGVAELQPFGGGRVDKQANLNFPSVVAAPGSSMTRGVAPAGSSVARFVAPAGSVIGRAGGSEQQPPGTAQRRWRGPDKISRIYGDWLEDL